MHALINIATMFAVMAVLAVVFLGIVVLLDRLVFPRLSFEGALRNNNLAVGIFLAGLLIALALVASKAFAGPLERYDESFRAEARLRFGYAPDWRWFKAQGVTESRLDPAVCSPAGACGVMQIMPGTAVAMGLRDRFDARESIRAGIRYDRRMWDEFTAPRPEQDRLAFALASYNAGLGHVLAAQRRAGHETSFARVAPFLWREPREYVQRIGQWWRRFAERPWNT